MSTSDLTTDLSAELTDGRSAPLDSSQPCKGRLATHTLLVGSGKGGVGKSTIAVNLAVAFAQQGLTVGLIDADIYGPSLPVMMGLRRLFPRSRQTEKGDEQLLPFVKYGVHLMSIGFLAAEAQPLVWRGPMVAKALEKMVSGTCWPELDMLLVDLPPGTGDVPISLAAQLAIDGMLVVVTPQTVAIVDAIKAVNALEQLQVPLLGVVENMSGFTTPRGDETYYLFGRGEGSELSRRLGVPLLASLPLLPALQLSTNEGVPAALQRGEGRVGNYFYDLSDQLAQSLY